MRGCLWFVRGSRYNGRSSADPTRLAVEGSGRQRARIFAHGPDSAALTEILGKLLVALRIVG
jgi:hypothetical protein